MARLSRRFQFLKQVFSQSYNPDNAVTLSVWAPALSLAATQAIDVSFFSSSYLDVSVQRVSPRLRVTGLRLPGCPIRISADLFSFANPRGFSQLSTSFFASKSLGIPHTPFSYFTFLPISIPKNLLILKCLSSLTQIPNPNRIKYLTLAKAQQPPISFFPLIRVNERSKLSFAQVRHCGFAPLHLDCDVASLKHRAAYL